MSFRPITSSNATSQNYGQINDMVRQLNNEQVTKIFKQPGGNSVITGKLPAGDSYGTLVYDTDNVARILIGNYNGSVGIWITKEGIDVLDELGA